MVDLSSRLGSLKEKGNGIQIMCFNWTQFRGFLDLGVKIQLLGISLGITVQQNKNMNCFEQKIVIFTLHFLTIEKLYF